jgi:hypothetical protein
MLREIAARRKEHTPLHQAAKQVAGFDASWEPQAGSLETIPLDDFKAAVEALRSAPHRDPLSDSSPDSSATLLQRKSAGEPIPESKLRTGRRRPIKELNAKWAASPLPRFFERTYVYIICALYSGAPAVIAKSYSMAEMNDMGRFNVFWVGMLMFLIPMAFRLMNPKTSVLERHIHLLYISIISMLPKYLRNPRGPIYFDEISHWSQVNRLVRNGRLFGPNSQVEIIENFPGLHALTGTMQLLTGLSTSYIGFCVLVILHILSIGGVALLTLRVTGSNRAGSLAGMIYAIGPATFFFNAMFSYQSFSIVLFIWFFISLSSIYINKPYEWLRTAWFWTALAIGITVNVTHHLTSYMMIMVLGMYAFSHTARAIRKRETLRNVRETYLLSLILVSFSVIWALTQAPRIVAYLSPYLVDGVGELSKQAEGSSEHAAPEDAPESHEFFKGSILPMYEQLLSFGVPVIAAGLAVLGVKSRKRVRTMRTGLLAITLFSGMYFAAFPMMMTPSGNEGGRRSWAFSSVAVSVVMGLGASNLKRGKWLIRRMFSDTLIVVCFVALAIGNIAADVNESSRFPGQFTYGSDTRGQTREARNAGHWLESTFGPFQRLIGDRYFGTQLTLNGSGLISAGSTEFPAWNFFISDQPISDDLLQKCLDQKYDFLAIDRRASEMVPEQGLYVDANEPGSPRETPAPRGAFTRYATTVWLTKVYSTTNYEIYRILWDLIPAKLGVQKPAGQR